MDGKLFIPYVNLSNGNEDSQTNFYNNTLSTFSKNITLESGGVDVVLWTMSYYLLRNFESGSPMKIEFANTEPYFGTTFAIHFNFGENNSHMNPNEQSTNPGQGTQDHIDILPLEMRYRLSENDESTDIVTEIKRDDVNFSFECFNRAVPIRKVSILEHDTAWSVFGDQPSQDNVTKYSVLGSPNNEQSIPQIHIDDTIGRSRFLCDPLKRLHQDCGFGNESWITSFIQGGYHDKYCDKSANAGDIVDLNNSILIRHLCAMTHPMDFGKGYSWNPVYGNNQVSVNSLMWGFPDLVSQYPQWPGCPDTKPWYPKKDYIGALGGPTLTYQTMSNAMFAVMNRLVFISRRYPNGSIWDYDNYSGGNKLGELSFWFGDIGANYAAKKGLLNCNNYSDHGMFIFNNADGHSILQNQKFNFMIVPSFYELNTAIDIIRNSNEFGTIKYRFRDHGNRDDLNHAYDCINGLERYENQQRDPAYPLQDPKYDFSTQCKTLQIFHLGSESAQWGPDNYSPF